MKKTYSAFERTGLALLVPFLCLVFSCHPDIDSIDQPPIHNALNDLEMVTGGVQGIVVNENNSPVAGAIVTSGAATTTTDHYGVFRFSNINLSKANGTVKIVQPGYFTAYRSFIAVQGRINNVRVKLLPKTNSGSFSATTGGTITMTGGSKLVMPANAIATVAGSAYTGQVNVAMTWIDPSSNDLPYTLMGDLRGITTAGEERGLSTYGMIGVELTDAGGQPLKIASGKTAELTFPIPALLQASAPATIDLWHFDEATARWKQEGRATRTGSNYIANVSHFSFWNCDVPFPLVDLCMRLFYINNQPVNNGQVRIKRLLNNTYGYGRTDSTGRVCGKIPKNEPLLLEVLDICNGVIYAQNIGPFNTATELAPITVALLPTNSLTISGTLINCAGSNVTNGSVYIYVPGANYFTVPVSNGVFNLTIPRCNSAAVTIALFGIDHSIQQQGLPQTLTGTTSINVGTIQACGISSAQYIDILLEGMPLIFLDEPPPQSIDHLNFPPTPPFANESTINTTRPSGTGFTHVSISFRHNYFSGAYPLINFRLALPGVPFSYYPVQPQNSMNITHIDNFPMGFIEGNFNILVNENGGPAKNLNCRFRVRRN